MRRAASKTIDAAGKGKPHSFINYQAFPETDDPQSSHGPDDGSAPADFQHPRICRAPLRRQRNRLARVEGDMHRYTFRDCHQRAKRLANALQALGVRMGERVATLAWNGYRHLEAYYAVSGSGAVLHTINPRLHPEQLAYICNHAEDQYLLFDFCFLPLVEAIAPHCSTSRASSCWAPDRMPAQTVIPTCCATKT
jgi:acyl-CoA synthetase (AMP-forming)/AMP-acid ligase II